MFKKKFTHFRIRMLSAAVLAFAGSIGLNEKVSAQVVINQNFTGQTASGWTATDVTSSGVNWVFDNPAGRSISGGTPGFDDDFAIFDSDFFCESDEEGTLESPSFDASLSGTFFLEFDNYFRANDIESASVEVWDGTTWNVAYSMLAQNGNNGYPTANHKRINITPFTGGSNAAKIRFHFMNGSCDWYWAIDNIVVNRETCIVPTATFAIVPNCSNGQFSISASITSLGSATSLTLSDGTTTYGAPISTIGAYNAGPFSNGSTKMITLIHNNSACNLSSDSLFFLCPPLNDSCSAATLLTVLPTCNPTNGTIIAAIAEDQLLSSPSCSNDYQGGDVWYSFVAADTGQLITVSSNSSALPVVFWDYGFSVYSGDCDNLSEQSCQTGYYFDSGDFAAAQAIVSGLTIGDTYRIRVYQDDSYDEDFNQISTPHTIDFSICVAPIPILPSCVTNVTPANGTINLSILPVSPVLTWNKDPNATSYEVYLGTVSGDESSLGSFTDTFASVNSLLFDSTYYWYVVPSNITGAPTGCLSNEFSFTVEAAPGAPINDDAPGAIQLTVGATCSGPSYFNNFATLSVGEPYPSCNSDQSQGSHSVWFKFVAPTSGSVKITTDVGPLGTLTDSRIGLFSTTNVNDYTTFNLIGCDDDNGVVGNGYMSTIFTTDLVGGQTYYVEVDGYTATTAGSYCIQVEEINPSMLSSTASCADLQTPLGSDAGYTGWVTLLDEAGKLVANVRNPAGGSVGDYEGSYNVDGTGFGMPRQDGNSVYYLSRNFVINNASISTPVDVRFYFHPGEIATLAGVTSNATNLTNLNITKQESNNCDANFDDANGTTSVLTQNANGAVNGVSWIQVTTSSFSNFYLMGGTTALTGTTVPLAIVIKSIAAKNIGKANQINWTTAEESNGDYFELERSNNGRTFNFLTKLAANEKPSDYVYYDKSPLENVNYYRLKLISRDGKITYSQTVQATLSANGMSVDAYPNPTDKSVTVKVHGSENGDVTLSDVSGRVVYQTKMKGSELQIDMSKLSNGFYLIHYVDGSLNKVIKVNKQ